MNAATLLQGIAETRFVPGGIADEHGLRLFVRDENGALSALAAPDGERLWQTREVEAPLVALNGAVLAARLRGTAALFHLCDEETGEIVWAAKNPVSFLPNAPLRGGRVVSNGSTMRLGWQAGTVAVDLESAAVALEPPMKRAPLPHHDQREIFPAADGQAVPWRVGDRIAALVVDGNRLVLVTSDPDGGAAREVELLSPLPRPGYLQHHRSPDVDHVFLLACNDRDEPDAPAGSICGWLVHRVRDGKRVVAFEQREGLAPPPAVVGERLLYLDSGYRPERKARPENVLHALDTASGEEVWSAPLAPGTLG